jgi:glycosyltransferase involved in cell wall biosynthesis
MHARAFAQPTGEYPLGVVHAVRSDGFAGVERYVATVSRVLAARGHRVTVIGGDASAMSRALEGANVEHRCASRTRDVSAALLACARNADVVHLHMTAAEAGALMAWPVVRAPAVSTRHFRAERGTHVASRLAAPIVRRRLAAQISISRFVADGIEEPSRTILNAVPATAPVDPVASVVLVAQRLEPEKRTDLALAAWAASGLAGAGWRLVIAGDGSERARLAADVRRRAICGVEMVGAGADIATLRRASGIQLATAPAEPFGLSVAEGMAAGLPVVAAGAGGHLETVGSARPDLLYRPDRPDECAAVLRRLAGDVGARRRAGAELRAFQQRHLDIDDHVDALLDVYAEVTVRSARTASTARTA